MITLHDVYEQGNDAVKKAVRAFGARHPVRGDVDAEPNWKQSENHFTLVIEIILGSAAPPTPGSSNSAVRRAENAAIDFLLAINDVLDFRCPICVKRQHLPL